MITPEPLPNEREQAIRARLEAVSPGPWERGDVWLWAGLIYSDSGDRVESGEATRCAFCHLGDPAWEGRADINGHRMPAHRHRSPEPYSPENAISSADGLVVYEGGGVVREEDAEFITSAPEDVRLLLAELERLRGVGAPGGPGKGAGVSRHEPYPPTPFYERLTELSQLEDGWLDGQGEKPSKAAVKAASVLGPDLPVEIHLYLYPTVAGGIALEWSDRHGQHEIEVLPDGLLSLTTVEQEPPGQNEVADALCTELYRRAQRLDEMGLSSPGCEQVRGEVIALQGAVGIALGGRVPDSSADLAGRDYYMAWLGRMKEQKA